MATFSFKLFSPDGLIYEGDTLQLTVQGSNGGFTIMAMHTDYSAVIVPCTLTVKNSEKVQISFLVPSGILQCKKNICTVVCDGAVLKQQSL